MEIEDVNNPKDYNELNESTKEILLNWIKENFIDSISYCEKSSYTLKHRFENSQKGFYITNGQFKGAMLQAGYHPKDSYDANWLFRVELIEKCKVISSPFNLWLKEQIDRNDPIGDVAKDTFNDLNWPNYQTKEDYLNYLGKVGACQYFLEAFNKAWEEFKKFDW